MNIETKFNFNDKVFIIGYSNIYKFIAYEFCGGLGFVIGKNSVKRGCPDCCWDKGKRVVTGKEWTTKEEITIGEVRIEKRCEHISGDETGFDNYGSQDESYKEQYMCYETGIGSGTLWPSERLFKTLEEAQKECDKRNDK